MKDKIKRAQLLLICLFVGFSGLVQAQDDNDQVSNENNSQVTVKKTVESIPVFDVKGVVKDAATDRPMIGVRVKVAEHQYSAISDTAGMFTIKVPANDVVLTFDASDYVLREVPLRGNTTLDIKMYPDVFAPVYGNIETLLGEKRKTLLLNPESEEHDFSVSSATTIETDIQSRMGGMVRTITRSGIAGIGSAMFIRGLNSLNANAQPLFVVDGVYWDNQLSNTSAHQGFFTNPLTTIDLKDIESVTVIRDGNSLYGSKGANGVVLINTVRGKGMATKITANAMLGLNLKPEFPSMMNASQYKLYASDMVQGYKRAYGYTDAEIADLKFLNEEMSSDYYTYHGNTDWADEAYHNSMSQSYSVNVNGGDEVALYNMSMGYTQNDGVLKETDMNRLNARFNSDIRMFTNMFAKVDLSFAYIQRNLRDDGVNTISSPGFLSLVKSPFLSSHRYNAQGKVTPKLDEADNLDPYNPLSNPMTLIESAIGTSKQYRFNLNANPYYNISKNVRLGTIFGFALNNVKESVFIPKTGVAEQRIGVWGEAENSVRDQVQRQTSIFSDTRVDWNFKVNEYNSFALSGGFRFIDNEYESDYILSYNTGNDNVKVVKTSQDYQLSMGDNLGWKSMSWYGNVDYDFRKKYFLGAALSVDASSRFGKATEDGFQLFDQSWALFPSVSGAWLISSEEFMRSLSTIDLLKLRLSYGLTGNDDIDNNAARTYFGTVPYMSNVNALTLKNIGNDAIQWETTVKANAGLDVSLLEDRLSLSVDVFNSKTKNLLTLKQMESSLYGTSTYWANDGELKNTGYEFSINGRIINTRDFTWELGGSIGHYKNEIVSLPDGDYTTSILGATILTSVGNPAGVFYGYKTDGVYANDAEAEAANLYIVNKRGGARSYFKAGDMRFVDANLDNEISTEDGKDDRQIIGDPNPDFYGTISTQFKYKRVAMNAWFTYSYGNDIYNYLRYQLESGSTMYNQTTAMLNRWTSNGQQTDMPKAVFGDPMGNSTFSDRWIEDGSYLRLKTLTLSYDMPLNLSFLPGIKVWASVNNLLTWSKYLGSDPESSISNAVLYQGIDAGLTPQSKSYYFGVTINL